MLLVESTRPGSSAAPIRCPTTLFTACACARFSGGYIGGVPPVPIPNTEVKPSRADGTARSPCGRVGRCRNFSPDAPPRFINAPRGVAFSRVRCALLEHDSSRDELPGGGHAFVVSRADGSVQLAEQLGSTARAALRNRAPCWIDANRLSGRERVMLGAEPEAFSTTVPARGVVLPNQLVPGRVATRGLPKSIERAHFNRLKRPATAFVGRRTGPTG